MKPFEELSYRGQRVRYRRFAGEALSRYNLGPARVTALRHDENLTYRVDGGDARYLLRVHRGRRRSLAQLRSEVLWLQALRREAGLQVPDPVPLPTGAFVGELEVPWLGRRRFVLFRWIEGRIHQRWPTLRPLERVGELLARIHEHGLGFERPAEFDRPRWTLEALCNGDESTGQWTDLEAEFRGVHLGARDRVLELGAGTPGPPRLGLIHGDFHHGNFLFRGGGVAAIDFDEAGLGDPAYDLASVLLWFRLRHQGDEALRLLLQGYRQVREFAPEREAAVELYTVARMLFMVLWRAGRSGNPSYDYWMRKMVPRSALRLRQWLDGGDPFSLPSIL